MGQQTSVTFWPSEDIEPGTYHIIHNTTGKALRIHDEDDQRLIIWDRQAQGPGRPETKKDHWFLLRSGEGYVFKHCQRGTYISISFKSDYPYPLLATPYPTTWVIYTKRGSSQLDCVIATDKVPSRVVSVDSGSNRAGANGDKLYLTRFSKDEIEGWRLERIGDATGEDEYTRLLRQQLKVSKTELVEDKSKLKIVEEQLAVTMEELTNLRSELNEATAELEEQREALDQAEEELSGATEKASEQEMMIVEKDRYISERDEIIRTKDAELAEKDRVISQLEEIARRSNERQPETIHPSSQHQSPRINRISPSPKPGVEAIAQAIQPRSSATTALSIRLAELGWESD
ncbi:unnamed protein product [Rhizoctonia solani]|uniref:Ricin B lectin domain-containing protein n=1 Tax=Rhizoctonia solani TaxID=456999 RepID=A0A8H3ATX5_9AGAM|nr:unnamed protein product [Rhizoctonia solani]CAE6467397.1 unnamed protein product [Rhizoctonia solani]